MINLIIFCMHNRTLSSLPPSIFLSISLPCLSLSLSVSLTLSLNLDYFVSLSIFVPYMSFYSTTPLTLFILICVSLIHTSFLCLSAYLPFCSFLHPVLVFIFSSLFVCSSIFLIYIILFL